MATSNLLPAGFLSTAGNQIIGPNGTAVRIDAIGWNGADGLGTLSGLGQASYKAILDTVKADGFNTIRIAWSDASLNTVPSSVSASLNPDLAGLTNLQIFQKIVGYAGQLGLKLMFDHHTNEGGPNGWGGQQGNGLWFDSGPGSNGTDGNGNTGTVTAAKFQSDWEALAKAVAPSSVDPYNTAASPVVIGFDLHNEALVNGNNSGGSPVDWGNNDATDILAMYKTVGSDLESIDPGALIIAEGPQEWSGTLLNGKAGLAPDGDLTMAAAKPVVLTVGNKTITNKVVYSDHEYPSEIGGEAYDSGTNYVRQLNQDWGYLMTQHSAPVWIGEMGASMDGTNGRTAQRDDNNWANTIVPYLNGKDASLGGPGFTSSQQFVPTDWWAAGYFPGLNPDGYFASWNGDPMPTNTAQQKIVSQLAPRTVTGAAATLAATPQALAVTDSAQPVPPSNPAEPPGQVIDGDLGTVPLTADNLHALGRPGAKFIVSGQDDVVGVAPLPGEVHIIDHGNGIHFAINGPGAHVVIEDFGKDPAAHITFSNSLGYGTAEQALAAAKSDGAGGLVLGNVDLVGVSSLTADQISIVRT